MNFFNPDILSRLIRCSLELVTQSSSILMQIPMEWGGVDDRDTTDQWQWGRVGGNSLGSIEAVFIANG
jgi:hypothetical protein